MLRPQGENIMKKILLGAIASLALASPAIAQSFNNAQLQQFLSKYFNSAINGEETVQYFCKPEYKTTFYAPTAYRILQIRGNDKVNYYVKTRVNSSNESGSPIVKIWEFSIAVKNRKLCISDFYSLSS